MPIPTLELLNTIVLVSVPAVFVLKVKEPSSVVEETSSGFLGGIMRKLPPILRRPARNLAQQVSIRNPLLAILNGQINTPFGDVSVNSGAVKNIVGL